MDSKVSYDTSLKNNKWEVWNILQLSDLERQYSDSDFWRNSLKGFQNLNDTSL